jgi:hypothetical protein
VAWLIGLHLPGPGLPVVPQSRQIQASPFLIAKYIAARAGGELRPAALEGPIGWWRSRLRDPRSEQKNKENYSYG